MRPFTITVIISEKGSPEKSVTASLENIPQASLMKAAEAVPMIILIQSLLNAEEKACS